MATLDEPGLKRVWFGPITYLIVAFLSSAINLVSLTRLENSVSTALTADIQGVLAGFTSVALIGFALQFVYARAIGQGYRGSWNLGFATASAIAFLVGLLTVFSIKSSLDFRITTGVWVGLATLSALIPTATLASHLVNGKWRSICLFVISGSVFRSFMWELPIARNSLSSLLAMLTISNLLTFLLLLAISQVKNYDEGRGLNLKDQRVPVGILTGMAILVVLGSIGRKSALGDSSTDFAELSLVGRNLFFNAAILAYVAFPFLTTHELFSRELGMRFRQSEALVVVSTFILGLSVFMNTFVAENMFGLDSDIDRKLLGITILSWSLLSISLIPILYYVAHGSQLGLATLAIAIGMTIAQFMTSTAYSLGLAFLLSTFLLTLIALVPALLRSRPLVRAEIAHDDAQIPAHIEEVTIVVPSHNSGSSGVATVIAIHDQFVSNGIDVRVIAVSDGSTDESVALFDSLTFDWFQHLCLSQNQGKGAALRAGFAQSTTTITGFIDADGDIPPHILVPMYREQIKRDADVVFGSKWHPESKVRVSGSRRVLSQIHHLIQRLLFKIDIDDTQVGIKLFKSSSLKTVLPSLQENGFSLDVELFVALAAHGYDNFVEMPVEIDRKGSSTVSFGNVFMSFFDLLRIFWRARISLSYEGRAYVSRNESKVSNK